MTYNLLNDNKPIWWLSDNPPIIKKLRNFIVNPDGQLQVQWKGATVDCSQPSIFSCFLFRSMSERWERRENWTPAHNGRSKGVGDGERKKYFSFAWFARFPPPTPRALFVSFFAFHLTPVAKSQMTSANESPGIEHHS